MSVEQYNKNTSILIPIIGFILIGVIWWCFISIKDYNLQNDQMLHKIKDVLKNLHPEIEKVKLYEGKKSYTLNKDKIYLCLKDENGEYYDINMLIYVFLHEFSHYLNKEDIGHTDTFYKIFNDLLKKAEDIGVYNKNIDPIKGYCGHTSN